MGQTLLITQIAHNIVRCPVSASEEKMVRFVNHKEDKGQEQLRFHALPSLPRNQPGGEGLMWRGWRTRLRMDRLSKSRK